MSPAATLPESLDLSYHVTKRSRAATPSAMKAFGRLVMDGNLMSLAGGLPHKSLFPMASATFTVPSADFLSGGDLTGWKTGDAETTTIHLRKDGTGIFANQPEGVLDLSQVLQYGMSTGFKELMDPLKEVTELVHGKPYSDAGLYISLGCTDGVSKAFQLLCEPDIDTCLCEEYAFGSSISTGKSKGVKFHPLKVDGQGIIPSDLDQVMSTWDESNQGKKPHTLYTVPCGSNPCGSVQSQERYDEIYALCQKHDIVIIEDDPYFPLQFKPYTSDKAARDAQIKEARESIPPRPTDGSPDDARIVAKIYNEYAGVRSYYSRDVDGRVVRLETFSKVAGPGLRLGWICANSMFIDRLVRLGETSTQVPGNVNQAIMASLLSEKNWGVAGWLRWCFGVRLEYQIKRDFFLDNLYKHVPTELVTTTEAGGGMFQWIEVHFEKHPRYVKKDAPVVPNQTLSLEDLKATQGSSVALVEKDAQTNTAELLQELFDALLADKVLVLPGYLFAVGGRGENLQDKTRFMRATFAGDLDQIEAALTQFGITIKKFFQSVGSDDSKFKSGFSSGNILY